ncbi:MAG: PhzF family phenazine biosynthesis protein [Hyphomicrobiaceae bacterium]
MRLAYHTLDVFTGTRFGGNPLAVVLDADGLDTAQMQAVAREFNISETVFVLKPANPAHSAKIRIFTPRAELPFAGHPTIGTAALLAELRASSMANMRQAIIALEETLGTVRVGVRMPAGEATFAEFDAPKLPQDLGGVPATEEIAGAIGLIPSEIGFENHKPTRFSAGLPYLMVPIRDIEALGRARADMGRWRRALGADCAVFVYCRETVHTNHHFHARMFAPDLGVAEDPATGSAAAAFAGVIVRFDDPKVGEHRCVIEQGYEMGRQSHISVTLIVGVGGLETVRIGGHSVRVMDGTIEV